MAIAAWVALCVSPTLTTVTICAASILQYACFRRKRELARSAFGQVSSRIVCASSQSCNGVRHPKDTLDVDGVHRPVNLRPT